MANINLTANPAITRRDFIGLFPAAGHARRLVDAIPSAPDWPYSSKELLAVPDLDGEGQTAVGDYLINEYRRADINEIMIVTREEKRDIMRHYGNSDRRWAGTHFTHILTPSTPSTAHSIDQGWEVFRERPVAFGFPDIIIRPSGVFDTLCQALIEHGSEVCLGLFPATHPAQCDMVRYHDNLVDHIEIKPAHTSLNMTWSCAVWLPAFSQFMHRAIAHYTDSEELYMGRLFQAAKRHGLRVTAVPFPAGFSLDIGTPESLRQALALRCHKS